MRKPKPETPRDPDRGALGYWRRVARARKELLRDALQSLRDLL